MRKQGIIFYKNTAAFLLVVILNVSFAQNVPDTLTQRQKTLRRTLLLGSVGTYTAGSLIFLDQVWYKQYPLTSFHFYNDNLQWCQMDKLGHMYSTYTGACLIWQALEWAGFEASPHQATVGHLTSGAMRWAGFSRKQSIIAGEVLGLLYLSSVEVMDGFSKGWGFSWGDEGANFAGGLAFSLQQYYWKEQRLRLKFSYHPTSYPSYRPSILGDNAAESLLKDYNGQTYWLSANIASLFLRKETKFPKWLNVSLGYGATGMVSGKSNQIINEMNPSQPSSSPNSLGLGNTTSFGPNGSPTSEIISPNGSIQYFTRYRRLFLSLDVDLNKIKTKSKFLKGVFAIFNSFKVPFPAIEWNKVKGVSVHGIYF